MMIREILIILWYNKVGHRQALTINKSSSISVFMKKLYESLKKNQ